MEKTEFLNHVAPYFNGNVGIEHFINENESFGEEEFFTQSPRNLSFRATEMSSLMILKKEDFL